MSDPYEELGRQLRSATDPYQKLGAFLQVHPADGPDQQTENVGASVADAVHSIVSMVADHVSPSSSSDEPHDDSSPSPSDGGQPSDPQNPLDQKQQLPDFLKPPPPPKIENPWDKFLKPPPSIEDLLGIPKQAKQATPAKPKTTNPLHITEAELKKMWPDAQPWALKAFLDYQDEILPKYGINTPKRLAQFMGQITVETGGGHEMVESLSYRPSKLATTSPWDSRMTEEERNEYGWTGRHHPANAAKLAEIGYGGRMGNETPEDALKYIGHGYMQKTGRSDYQALTDTLGKKYGVDFVKDPNALNDPKHALEYAADEFAGYKIGSKPLLDYADRWDTTSVSQRINGGNNQLKDRIRSANEWLKLLTNPKRGKSK